MGSGLFGGLGPVCRPILACLVGSGPGFWPFLAYFEVQCLDLEGPGPGFGPILVFIDLEFPCDLYVALWCVTMKTLFLDDGTCEQVLTLHIWYVGDM